jgi:hypothetical protein
VNETKIEKRIRQNLRSARAIGGLDNPNAVALLHGTLAGYSRRGASVSKDVFVGWAADEGWPADTLPVLREVLLGPFRIAGDDFQTLTGFRRDEADVLLDALGDSLADPPAH